MKDETQQDAENPNQEGENLNPAEPAKTPLEMVREQQARMQNHEVQEQRVEAGDEIPGHSKPSDRRHHPQRQTNYSAG